MKKEAAEDKLTRVSKKAPLIPDHSRVPVSNREGTRTHVSQQVQLSGGVVVGVRLDELGPETINRQSKKQVLQ